MHRHRARLAATALDHSRESTRDARKLASDRWPDRFRSPRYFEIADEISWLAQAARSGAQLRAIMIAFLLSPAASSIDFVSPRSFLLARPFAGNDNFLAGLQRYLSRDADRQGM